MKIYSETSLRDFNFWSGACDTVKYLTDDEMDTIESILEDIYPDGLTDTELNDIFWFDDDTVAKWLGYDSFKSLMHRDDEDDEEDADEDEDPEGWTDEKQNAFDDFCARFHDCGGCPYKELETLIECQLHWENEIYST